MKVTIRFTPEGLEVREHFRADVESLKAQRITF